MTTRISKLRFWKHADGGMIRDLDIQCFPAPDVSFSNGPNYHWWVLDNGQGFVAFAGVYVGANGVARFTRAGTLPAFRGRGYQKALIRARIQWCRRRGIKTIKTYTSLDNKISAANLKSFGFKGRVNKGQNRINFLLSL